MCKVPIIFVFLSWLMIPAHADEPKTLNDAIWTVSTDPTKPLLKISTSGMDGTRRSALLYGDGRLQLEHNYYGNWEQQLSTEEIHAIISIAVTHGLAEWDSETILARQVHKYGSPFPGVDGLYVGILLSLESYERGSYKPSGPLSRSFGVRSPRSAAKHFPDWPEYPGIEKLVKWLRDRIEAARKADK